MRPSAVGEKEVKLIQRQTALAGGLGERCGHVKTESHVAVDVERNFIDHLATTRPREGRSATRTGVVFGNVGGSN